MRTVRTLVAGVVLSCPRFMFYDMTLAVCPVFIAFADWPRLSRGDRRTLVCLAAALWIGTAYEYDQWSMLGPPLDTFALFGLWLWGIAKTKRK